MSDGVTEESVELNEPVDMTEEAQPVEAEATATDPQSQQQVNLKSGYVVGMTEEGNFVFDTLGDATGLVELLGLHQHAQLRIDRIHDQKTGGNPLTVRVGEMVAELHRKLDQVSEKVGVKQPDNQL